MSRKLEMKSYEERTKELEVFFLEKRRVGMVECELVFFTERKTQRRVRSVFHCCRMEDIE